MLVSFGMNGLFKLGTNDKTAGLAKLAAMFVKNVSCSSLEGIGIVWIGHGKH